MISEKGAQSIAACRPSEKQVVCVSGATPDTRLVLRAFIRKLPALLLSATFLSLVPASQAATLPAGTQLEVRLISGSGSRVSHPGDRIEARIIAPVLEKDRLLLPVGSLISGEIESVDRLGLGLKHYTASLQYRFDSVRLPDGRVFPVKTQVRQVETARERVSESGVIGGIYPTASLSSGASFFVSALISEPAIAVPMLAVKFLIARSPDGEIYFPAGTELILETTSDVATPNLRAAPDAVAAMSRKDRSGARRLLESLPQQQADLGGRRPSDLVNVLLLGSRDQINRAFQAAGWNGAHRHSAVAVYRMYHSIVQRAGYGMAPMANLTLNGTIPDVSYQKSLDTFSKRHHIRLWKQEDKGAWLGAATEDTGYTVRRMHFTHATDPDIDDERAKVVNDLWLTGCIDSASLIDRAALTVAGLNRAAIRTDGRVAALRLNDCQIPAASPGTSVRPRKQPRSRLVQVVRAVGIDLVRSNPISLSYNAIKSISTDSTPKGEGIVASPDFRTKPAVANTPENVQDYTRQRVSVIDARDAMLAHAERELEAGRIAAQHAPGQGQYASTASYAAGRR